MAATFCLWVGAFQGCGDAPMQPGAFPARVHLRQQDFAQLVVTELPRVLADLQDRQIRAGAQPGLDRDRRPARGPVELTQDIQVDPPARHRGRVQQPLGPRGYTGQPSFQDRPYAARQDLRRQPVRTHVGQSSRGLRPLPHHFYDEERVSFGLLMQAFDDLGARRRGAEHGLDDLVDAGFVKASQLDRFGVGQRGGQLGALVIAVSPQQ